MDRAGIFYPPGGFVHFDATITLGTLIQVGSMGLLAVAVFNAVSARLTIFENILKTHAEFIKDHADRFDAYDARFLSVVSDLQRLIGRSEIHRRP